MGLADRSNEEMRLLVNAALAQFIDDAGGVVTIKVSDLLMGTLALDLSPDKTLLTLKRINLGR